VVGLLEGIAFGLFLAVIIFVINYSRLNPIKNETTGDMHDSIVVRNPEERQYLEVESRRIHIMILQGFLFFGTADRLLRIIRRRIEKPTRVDQDESLESRRVPAEGLTDIDYLVLDFNNVSEMDTSAIQVFGRLRQVAERENVTIILTRLTELNQQRLAAIGFFNESKNGNSPGLVRSSVGEGVAWCEEDLLCKYEKPSSFAGSGLEQQLNRMIGNQEAAQKLVPYFESKVLPIGAYLFHEGDLSSSMYLLGTGVASVVIGYDTDSERVVRVFEEGTILGEMALFTGEPRTASVRVEEDAVFFCLERERFYEAQIEQPAATGWLLSYIVRLVAERLNRANREIQSLSS